MPYNAPPQNPQTMYRNPNGSDITLFYGPHGTLHFDIHGAILMNASPWFRDIFNANPNVRQIVLPGDPVAIVAFLEFCYLQTYTALADPYSSADAAKAAFEFHACVFVVADKFRVHGLAAVALQNLRAALEGAEANLAEECADVWEWGVECMYLHGDVLNLTEEEETWPSPTLRESLEQLRQQQTSVPDGVVAADGVECRRSARDRLKGVIVDAAVELYRGNRSFRLLRRVARVAGDIPEFGAEVARQVLDPGL